MSTVPMTGRAQRTLHKEPVLERVGAADRSALGRYADFFVGRPGLLALMRYELAVCLGASPGALGYLLRKRLFPGLLRSAGRGLLFGARLAIRHPGRIDIGDESAIDDDCLLDARGGGEEGIRIGNGVLVARGCIVQCKLGPISIGDECNIGHGCILTSAGGIHLGRNVLVAARCYIGGGRYRTELTGAPIMHQEHYSHGPVRIGDDVWLGAGVSVLDGVSIGDGSVVGAGMTVRKDLPPNTILVPEPPHSLRERRPPAAGRHAHNGLPVSEEASS